MFGATKEYANAVHGLTTRVNPEALRENTSPACSAACCMASRRAGTFASSIMILPPFVRLVIPIQLFQTEKCFVQPISHSPFLDQSDLKRRTFTMNNEIEF